MSILYFFTVLTFFAHVSGQSIIESPYGTKYFLIKEYLTFNQAAVKCAARGATMATTKTEAEVDFVSQQFGNAFLRAIVEKVNGKCVAKWLIDGSEVTNANWRREYTKCDGDYCVMLFSNKVWWMYPCSHKSSETLCQVTYSAEERLVEPLIEEESSSSLLKNENCLQLNLVEVLEKLDKKVDTLMDKFEDMSVGLRDCRQKVDYLYG